MGYLSTEDARVGLNSKTKTTRRERTTRSTASLFAWTRVDQRERGRDTHRDRLDMPLASSRALLDGVDESTALLDGGCWQSDKADGARGGRLFANRRRPLSLCAMVIGAVSLLAVSATTWAPIRYVGDRTMRRGRGRPHESRHGSRRGRGLPRESWHKLPPHCDGVDMNTAAPVSDDVRAMLSNATYVAGFWRLRRPSHHSAGEYLWGIRETACKYGNAAVNTLFVEDGVDMCDMVTHWYEVGRNVTSVHAPLGKGNVHCEVRTMRDFPLTLTQCRKAHVPVWVNKIPIFGEIVEKVHNGEISSKMRASKYFWVDADIGRLPGVIDQEFNQSYGDRDEDKEDKFWTKCYEPALPAPRRMMQQCRWLHHEVVANIFGGSAESIINYSRGYVQYVNLHVPTRENGQRPAEVSCPCPTEEQLMTTMSRDPKFEDLYASKSCARNWRRHVRG